MMCYYKGEHVSLSIELWLINFLTCCCSLKPSPKREALSYPAALRHRLNQLLHDHIVDHLLCSLVQFLIF